MNKAPTHNDPAKVPAMAQSPDKQWRFWIDRGGTFTDVIARTPAGELRAARALGGLDGRRDGLDPPVQVSEIECHGPLDPR